MRIVQGWENLVWTNVCCQTVSNGYWWDRERRTEQFGENFPLTKFIYVLLGLFNNMGVLHLHSESISKTEIFMVHLVYLRSHLDPGDIEMSK